MSHLRETTVTKITRTYPAGGSAGGQHCVKCSDLNIGSRTLKQLYNTWGLVPDVCCPSHSKTSAQQDKNRSKFEKENL